MPVLETLDDFGIRYLITPMSLLNRLHLINTFDDIGITLVCRPLRYMHRFAAFLLDSELYPIVSYSNMSLAHLAGLKADESLVSSMSRCSISLRSGGGGGSSRRVSERGRVRKSRSRRSGVSSSGRSGRSASVRSGGSRGSASVSGTRGSSTLRGIESIDSKGKRRSNGHA